MRAASASSPKTLQKREKKTDLKLYSWTCIFPKKWKTLFLYKKDTCGWGPKVPVISAKKDNVQKKNLKHVFALKRLT